MASRTRIWLIVSLAITATAAIIFAVFFYHPKLTVIPTPGDAEVLVNGQAVTSGVPVKLAPGTYLVTVRALGYLTSTQTVRLGISQITHLTPVLRQVPTARPLVGGAQFAVLTTDQKALLYLGKDGSQFFRVETDLGSDGKAQVRAITPERFTQLANVVWSPDRSLALLQNASGQTSLFDFKRYDLLTQEEHPLGNDFRNLTWHPTEAQFVGFSTTPAGERSLVRHDIATAREDRLVDLRSYNLTNPVLDWSADGRTILLAERGLYLFDLSTRKLQKIAGTDDVRAAHWSPTSQFIVAETDRDLFLISPTGSSAAGRLDVRSTLSKSAWSVDGSYLLTATATDHNQDRFDLITTETGAKTALSYTSDHPVHAENLLTEASKKKLWFVSEGTIYSVLLEPADTVQP